jgi:hypothetical protein
MTELFKIFKLTEERAAEIAAMPDEPHFHDFEELLVGMEGALEHFIDFRKEEFDAPYVSFVTNARSGLFASGANSFRKLLSSCTRITTIRPTL